jgi:predicted TIM-barrel fold metal-dependent hydrolase
VRGTGGPDHRSCRTIARRRAVRRATRLCPHIAGISRLDDPLGPSRRGAWRQTLEIARRFSNAYFDCYEIIAWTGAPGAHTEDELARLIVEIGSERVLVGSDFPWYDLDDTVERVLNLPILSREEKEAILGGNAMRLLRM